MSEFYLWVAEHPAWASAILFIVFYALFQSQFPGFMYFPQGTGLRQFGVGYRNKTILPLWLFSIVLAILCYLFVTCYIQYSY